MKKVVVINAGPRKGWNTDRLVSSAERGANDSQAQTIHFDLFKLESYTGCISCFGCKQKKTYGRCVCNDGLTPVLDAIREADGLIIGSPNYLGNLTASFRALYERLIFESLTYNLENPCSNSRKIPVLLIMTSNCSEKMYTEVGYMSMLENYKANLDRFVGKTEIMCCGDTLQVEDYGKYDWTMFDPESKMKRHNETFEGYISMAYEMGRNLC